MVIAALVTFAILVIAWIAAPERPLRAPAPEPMLPEVPEPMPA